MIAAIYTAKEGCVMLAAGAQADRRVSTARGWFRQIAGPGE